MLTLESNFFCIKKINNLTVESFLYNAYKICNVLKLLTRIYQ